MTHEVSTVPVSQEFLLTLIYRSNQLYNKYAVEIKFRNRVYGGLPKSKELVKQYVQAKFGSEDTSKVAEDLDLEEELEKSVTGFKCDDRGIYMGSYCLKAAMKQYTSLMKLTVQKRGSKQTVKETLFIKGKVDDELTSEKVYFQPMTVKPHGLEDFAGHVSTMQGMRSILKSSEYIEHGVMQFEIWCLAVRMEKRTELTAQDIEDCLTFGQECGLGSCRSFESGKYDLVKFEELMEEKKS